MNKIRYKQWNGIAKEWHIWGLIDNKFVMPIIVRSELWVDYPSFQSTGLHDSKGVEIWEEDIIEYDCVNHYRLGHVRNVGIVVYEACSYEIEWQSGPMRLGRTLYDVCKKYTVIGDTMQTPELMEVKK